MTLIKNVGHMRFSNILTVAFSVTLPVEIYNPVPPAKYDFNYSVSLNAFASNEQQAK